MKKIERALLEENIKWAWRMVADTAKGFGREVDVKQTAQRLAKTYKTTPFVAMRIYYKV